MSKLTERFKNIGPGALVAAAFIGPGTVTTATVSGASFGYTLLWAMLFSTLATMTFQEMSARLGVVSRQGLGEALRNQFSNPIAKFFAIVLVVSAIFIGNSAYETGNIMGGALGLKSVFPTISSQIWGPLLGIVAFIMLWSGSYKRIEKVLVTLVIIMSITFFVTAVVTLPDVGAILRGLFIPTVPNTDRAWLTVVGLIGTTVVPYNLFLHASAVQEKWSKPEQAKEARMDTIISITLGGFISMAIIVTASAAFYGTATEIKDAGQMAVQLEPLLGSWAKWFFAIGLFSAGFSSAIAAPLAAAYAMSGALGWKKDLKDIKFKVVWMFILAIGILLSALGKKSPIEVILFAQAANAIILPIIAIFLYFALNNKEKMGEYKNNLATNVLSIAVILVTILISYRSLLLFIEKVSSMMK
ncbi:MAG: manganese transport protein [Clostridiales bacterium]|nr:manganese transport protein [Clostridiales bacterium]MDK2932241.1 manganese transport protein [Clostridiales bacterium]